MQHKHTGQICHKNTYPLPHIPTVVHIPTHTYTHTQIEVGKKVLAWVGMAEQQSKERLKAALLCCLLHLLTLLLLLPTRWSFPFSLLKAEPSLGSWEWRKDFYLFPVLSLVTSYKFWPGLMTNGDTEVRWLGCRPLGRMRPVTSS